MPIEWLLDNIHLLKDSLHKWLSGFRGCIWTSEFTPEWGSLLGGLEMPVLQVPRGYMSVPKGSAFFYRMQWHR